MTRNPSSFSFAMLALAALGLGACTGPMGPSGTDAPNTKAICYYCDNFDSGTLSGWMVQAGDSNGPISVYLDSTMFNSPTQSLGVSCTGLVGYDAQVYRNISIDQKKDLWVEFDFNLTGAYNAGQEFFINLGGSDNNAVLGWDGQGIYLVQGSSHIYVLSSPDISSWHHAKIQVTPNSGKSNYWMDGLALGSGYTTLNPVVGYPAASGFIVGIKPTSGLNSFYHIDNLQCYHL